MITQDTIPAPPPLSPELAKLLDHERVIEDRPEIVRARLMARARESLRLPAPPLPRTHSPRISTWRPVWAAAAAGVMLITTVAVAFQLLREPSAPTTPSDETMQKKTTAIPEQEPALDLPAVADEMEPVQETASSPRATAPGKTGNVAEELRFLDRARQADSRGDSATVLSVAVEHERRFPRGRLSEEREVLRVRALVRLGRAGEARATAAKFHRHYPRSVLARTIDDLLTTLR